jgi:hypothetical protein
LKDILNQVEFATENPRVLSEFFLTCVASDGYKVVFSWNEIFNTSTGDHVYLITSKASQPLSSLNDRLLLVTTTIFKTGRHHVKGLQKNNGATRAINQ